jgi:hypothetical protein
MTISNVILKVDICTFNNMSGWAEKVYGIKLVHRRKIMKEQGVTPI